MFSGEYDFRSLRESDYGIDGRNGGTDDEYSAHWELSYTIARATSCRCTIDIWNGEFDIKNYSIIIKRWGV